MVRESKIGDLTEDQCNQLAVALLEAEDDEGPNALDQLIERGQLKNLSPGKDQCNDLANALLEGGLYSANLLARLLEDNKLPELTLNEEQFKRFVTLFIMETPVPQFRLQG
jgi:hypothetical protein